MVITLSSFANKRAEKQFELKHWNNHTYCLEKEFLFFPKKNFRMEEANKLNMSLILYMLPPEIFEKILKLLNFKDICQAQLVCKRWKDIIVKGNLVKKASGKTFTN